MPQVNANGVRINYEITGDGPRTIVWTHGIGSSLQTWNQDLPQFPGFRHVAYDVRGMGQSEGTEGPVSLELWAKDLDALMGALNIDHAIIAGHSMGGAISQRFAIDFPQRVEALLLLSTSSRVGALAAERWLKQADETDKTKPHLAAAQRAVARYTMDEDLKGFDFPTLIIVGDADPTTPAGGSVIMNRLICNSELQIFPGIGHSILHDEPKAVARARDWLAQFQ